MYAKLLAYEIRSRLVTDARSFGAFLAVIAIASGIVAAGLPGISGSTTMLAYALCALTPAACAIAAMGDYWKTLYGQRGYFTMSLPISGTVIFWAKITRIMIECLLALALAVGGIMVVASAAAWSDGISFAEYTAGPRSLVAGVPTSTVVLMIAAQVILSMSWIIQGCAVMSIGAQGRFNHLGFGAPSSVLSSCTSLIRSYPWSQRSSSRCPSRPTDTSPPKSCGPRTARRWEPTVNPTSSASAPTSSCLSSRYS